MYSQKLRVAILSLTALITVAASFNSASAEELTSTGKAGYSTEYGSGWVDFAPPITFNKGDRLKILIGGTAKKILVRLLPKGKSPDTPTGIIGGAVTVPSSRIVEITLDDDRKDIVQLSVHGAPNPWGQFPLGGDNGPATIMSAERSASASKSH